MIFVSVGTQLGFDRLVRAVDEWRASQHGVRVVAQIGAGSYEPLNMWSTPAMDTTSYERLVESSDLLVTHAGVGSLLAARRWRKPVIMLPRRAELGEHRNNHQVEGAAELFRARGAYIAEDIEQLKDLLDRRLELRAPSALESESAGLGVRLGELLDMGLEQAR